MNLPTTFIDLRILKIRITNDAKCSISAMYLKKYIAFSSYQKLITWFVLNNIYFYFKTFFSNLSPITHNAHPLIFFFVKLFQKPADDHKLGFIIILTSKNWKDINKKKTLGEFSLISLKRYQ